MSEARDCWPIRRRCARSWSRRPAPGQPISYSEVLGLLGHHFSRPKMRALCKVLTFVDDEAEERGEPELAVLVVRQSDGLPGQGWWIGGAKKHGYTGPVGGAQGGEADPQAAAAGVRVLGGTRGLAFAKRAARERRPHLHRQRGRRRHPAGPLVQAASAGGQLQHRLALGADRAAAARGQARGARRPGRGGAGDPRSAAGSRAGASGAGAAAGATR